jgi:hypothetical protein
MYNPGCFQQKKFEGTQTIETSEDSPIKELFCKPLRLISSMLFIGISLITTDILQSRCNYVFKNMFQIWNFFWTFLSRSRELNWKIAGDINCASSSSVICPIFVWTFLEESCAALIVTIFYVWVKHIFKMFSMYF